MANVSDSLLINVELDLNFETIYAFSTMSEMQ